MDNTNTRGNMLIVGATVVLPNETKHADVRTVDGVITDISEPQLLEHHDGELLIDGSSLHLLPGAIDPQVHFRDPGQP